MTRNTNRIENFVRAPLDPAAGRPFDACHYALFPGLTLAASEPGLIVLLYDSLLQQYADTGIMLLPAGEPVPNASSSAEVDEGGSAANGGTMGHPTVSDHTSAAESTEQCSTILQAWETLGEPVLLTCNPEDTAWLHQHLPEIQLRSLYDLLLSCGISGGCNRELYRLAHPAGAGSDADLRTLAEDMGVSLYEGADALSGPDDPDAGPLFQATDGRSAVDSVPAASVTAADAAKIPFLTGSIEVRNAMKKRGFDAVHILELIYGMGASNQHLAHSHEGQHDHDAPPRIRETVMTDEERAAQEALFSPAARAANLAQLQEMLRSLFWGE